MQSSFAFCPVNCSWLKGIYLSQRLRACLFCPSPGIHANLPIRPQLQSAAYNVMAHAEERLRLRTPPASILRQGIRTCHGLLDSRLSGKPRVSGPKTRASSLLNSKSGSALAAFVLARTNLCPLLSLVSLCQSGQIRIFTFGQ